MKSLRGQFLIAAHSLVDPNFFRSVVWMVEHNEEGALGLIVNRPTETTLRTAWEQVGHAECRHDGLLYFGGPCQGLLTAAHQDVELANVVVAEGMCFTQSSEKIELLVGSGVAPAKYFVGYAGWGGGQLEMEMEEGSWLVASPSPEQVFDASEELWENLVRQVSGEQFLAMLKIKHVPNDPSMN